ncbi:ABC-2 family transporter protein Pps (plasmid) [Peptoclostridium acidaminophilum DSM 3953]|uniref:ABC-2 family transporter protein Pps n=1 Tax=Peptoclostridium acidaminophilum DSM 3953 TaxID=1286171 RepID=W8TIY2_PEPAC|nr:PEP/pyruvate-binding domain-containing protein [Peptoclostridium acidaminophilum]AHM57753.1 ABC-2 family transporter protein Pps [Peptoclostridium acidaminophilum DSM 3953]
MIVGLEDSEKNTLERVGSKALNLSKMKREGFMVPDGFTISSEAYKSYLDRNNLNSQIKAILDSESTDKSKSEQIKALFDVAKLPEEIKEKIMSALRSLGVQQVAVRSSSNAEDLPDMSFAGQYSSYLNVTKDNLLKKVIACWQSLWNERAMTYRKQFGLEEDLTHAVIVQEMVNSEVAGVLFTANPTNGIRSQYIINVSYGLGEAVVSGAVNPDQYIYSIEEQNLISSTIGTKEILYAYGNAGIEAHPVDSKRNMESSLSIEDIQRLVEVAQGIHAYFGKPQDIEFAINKGGEIFVLQSRDITALFPIDQFKQDGKLRAYMAASSVLLGMKEAFTPLGADIYGGMFPTVLEVMTATKKKIPGDFVTYTGARIFLDISYMLSNRFVGKSFGNAFSGSDLPLKRTMDQLLADHGKTFRHQGIRFKIPFGIFRYGLSMIGSMKGIKKLSAEEKYEAVRRLGEEFHREIVMQSMEKKILREILDYCDEIMMKAFILSQKQALYCVEAKNYAKIERKVKALFGNRFNLDILTYALPDCVTMELNLELNRLAKHFTEKDMPVDVNDERMKTMLRKFGHRGNLELDLGTERWRENPKFLIDRVKQYMKDRAYEKNISEITSKAKEADELIEEIYEAAKAKRGKRYAVRLKKMMQTYRTAAGMREYPKFNIVQGLDVARQMLLEVGVHMKNEGVLENENDIFYLHRDEILNACERKAQLDVKALINSAKDNYEKEMKRNCIPRFVLNTGETYYSGKVLSDKGNVLQGIPLSSGVYEGRIRIVTDPNDSNLLEGEVMVAESTNPAWTPLFMTAKALIMEYGGPLSHGGIVAREYGIPAVVGISMQNKLLRNGQLVRVNGNTGHVEILE